MKTEVLTIKREFPAIRCEICHQADCFTPETNVCTRCAGIPIAGAEVRVSERALPTFRTLLEYQDARSLVRDWTVSIIAFVPLGLFFLGLMLKSDVATYNLWAVAFWLAVFLVAVTLFKFWKRLFDNEYDDTPIALLFAFNLFFVAGFLFFRFDILIRWWGVWFIGFRCEN